MAEKKSALVTGAGRGIGRAISLELAKAGYFIIINYRANEAAARETLEAIKKAGSDGEMFRFDVRDSRECAASMEQILSKYDNIEILVNNAGVVADGLFIMMPEKDWDSVIDTSLKGFYNVTKPVVKKMLRKKRGSVVTVSSLSGLIGNRGQVNYSAAKAGLIAASRSLASEVARLGVRVNVVAPGLIDSEMIKDAPMDRIKQMIPMGRIGRPEEVAKVVRFLCSDDASYVTGQVIGINGGMY